MGVVPVSTMEIRIGATFQQHPHFGMPSVSGGLAQCGTTIVERVDILAELLDAPS